MQCYSVIVEPRLTCSSCVRLLSLRSIVIICEDWDGSIVDKAVMPVNDRCGKIEGDMLPLS